MSKQFLVPKIKKKEILTKVMMEPYNIGKNLFQNQFPELTQDSLILSMTPQKQSLAKLSPEGSLKINVKYNAEVIALVNRYVEVMVIDDYDDFWVGMLFGITVKGTGGKGNVRGCIVKRIEGQTMIVEAINEGGKQIWKNLEGRVNEILGKSDW